MYADGDVPGVLRRVGAAGLDRTVAMMRRLYPGWEINECEGSTLWDGVYDPKGTAYAASWPGLDVIGDQRVMIDLPSQLPEHLVSASAGRRLVLHARHSVVDWLAFAVWEDGGLVRSLSLSPDSGIIENIGEPLPFELPTGPETAQPTSSPGRTRTTSRTRCRSTPWNWAKTHCERSAASSRRAAPSRTIRTALIPRSRKRSCVEQWKPWDRHACTHSGSTARRSRLCRSRSAFSSSGVKTREQSGQ
ncbi:hypothetical protein RKD20_005704 [Streptomyces sp. SLBN-8D4]